MASVCLKREIWIRNDVMLSGQMSGPLVLNSHHLNKVPIVQEPFL